MFRRYSIYSLKFIYSLVQNAHLVDNPLENMCASLAICLTLILQRNNSIAKTVVSVDKVAKTSSSTVTTANAVSQLRLKTTTNALKTQLVRNVQSAYKSNTTLLSNLYSSSVDIPFTRLVLKTWPNINTNALSVLRVSATCGSTIGN